MTLFTNPDRGLAVAERINLRHLDEIRAAYTQVTGRPATFNGMADFVAAREAYADAVGREAWIAAGSTAPAAFWAGADPLTVAFLENVDHLFDRGTIDCFGTWLDAVAEIGLVDPAIVERGLALVGSVAPTDDARSVDLEDMELVLTSDDGTEIWCYMDGDAVDLYRSGHKFMTEPVETFPKLFLQSYSGDWVAGYPGAVANMSRPLTEVDRLHDILPATLADGSAFFDGRVVTDPEEILARVNAQEALVWGGRYHFAGDDTRELASGVLDYFGDPVERPAMDVWIDGKWRELCPGGLVDTAEVVRVMSIGMLPSGLPDGSGMVVMEVVGHGYQEITTSAKMSELAWVLVPSRYGRPLIAFDPERVPPLGWLRRTFTDGSERIVRHLGPDRWAVVETDPCGGYRRL